MISADEIRYKDYKTLTYKGVDIPTSPELIQEINTGTVELSVIERHIYDQYEKYLSFFRNMKINQILDETN